MSNDTGWKVFINRGVQGQKNNAGNRCPNVSKSTDYCGFSLKVIIFHSHQMQLKNLLEGTIVPNLV